MTSLRKRLAGTGGRVVRQAVLHIDSELNSYSSGGGGVWERTLQVPGRATHSAACSGFAWFIA